MRSSRGFTLIEIMIVTAILAGIAVIGFSRFNRGSNEIKSLVRKISVLTKQTHHRARMTNRVYRIVFDMNREETSSVWVESAPKGVMLTENSYNEAPKPEGEEEEKDPDEKPKPQFVSDALLKQPLKFPKLIKISEVEIKGQKESFQEGRSYLYFFPEGLTQEAAIHLTDGDKLNWTIVVNPVTGQSFVLNENKPLRELRNE